MTDAPGFVTIERQSVVALAIEQIRRMIISGALQPGQRLPGERALSNLFGVSRPSVREAVRALSYLGVLETRHGSGTYVSEAGPETLANTLSPLLSLSPEALDNLREVRIWLESGAAEVAAERITKEQLTRLEGILADAGAALDDLEAFVECDVRFHATIAEASHNAIAISLMQTIAEMARRGRLARHRTREMREAVHRSHREIFEALHAGDAVAAKEATAAHVVTILRMEEQEAKVPEGKAV